MGGSSRLPRRVGSVNRMCAARVPRPRQDCSRNSGAAEQAPRGVRDRKKVGRCAESCGAAPATAIDRHRWTLPPARRRSRLQRDNRSEPKRAQSAHCRVRPDKPDRPFQPCASPKPDRLESTMSGSLLTPALPVGSRPSGAISSALCPGPCVKTRPQVWSDYGLSTSLGRRTSCSQDHER